MKYFPLLFAPSSNSPLRSPPMKPRFSLLAAAALSFAFCAPAQGTTHTNLYEAFSTATGKWSGSSTFKPDLNGWTFDSGVYGALGGARIGTSSAASSLTSPLISLRVPDQETTIHIRIQAAAYYNKAGGLSLTAVDETDNPISGAAWTKTLKSHSSTDAVELDESDSELWFDDMSFTTSDSFKLVFTSSRTTPNDTLRVLLGNILVTENLPVLTTPENLRVSGTTNANDFAVAWNGVTGAQGYSVKLLDANDAVVYSNGVASATTTASFTELTSSSEYTVVIVALGDHTTTDDSAPATLTVETAASAAAAPTLTVNTSWTAGVAGTSAVSATLEGNIACTVETVSMSDGSTATIANGVLSWTPPASNLASSVTATFHVTHGTDGWDLAQVLSVAATPAPAAPAISFDNVSRRSFDASWSVTGGGPVVSYKIRAWTGRSTPDDATGGVSENFSGYVANGTAAGWTFDHAEAYTGSTYATAPVGFKSVSGSAISPDFGGCISSLSFRLRSISAEGSFIVSAATSGSDDWAVVTNYTSEAGTFKTENKTVSLDPAAGYSKIKFEFVRTGGSASFGSFSVSGNDWPAADFLAGWGGAKVSVGAATSQRFSNPVAGTANYVEVTAIGPSGLVTSAIRSVDIPHAPGGVISVK